MMWHEYIFFLRGRDKRAGNDSRSMIHISFLSTYIFCVKYSRPCFPFYFFQYLFQKQVVSSKLVDYNFTDYIFLSYICIRFE